MGIIGPNGAGKTTLFKMILGQEMPDAGQFIIGESVQLSYVDQNRLLDASKTILEVVANNQEHIKIGTRDINARAYISKFNFSGDDHH